MSLQREPIAVVGMSCLFPESASLEDYWSTIKQGRDAVGPIPVSHWSPEDYYDEDPKKTDHTYAKTGAFLDTYQFDPLKYGMTPSSLEATDTTQLLGMVVAEKALLNAGIGKESTVDRDRISCILGVTGTLELVVPLSARLGHPHWRRSLERAGLDRDFIEEIVADVSRSFVGWQEASFPGLLGNVVAGRIANRLNLGGSNAVVDAACASSLAALRTAVMELQSHRCDVALTGGMDTFNDIFMYMCFSKTPALSPTGQARPFDANGDGTILGEGLGAVVLKRLSDAKRDGDRIYAVIKGLGSSSDGKGKAIYAPSAFGQQKALRRAYTDAGISPSQIELVECHGTGTKVGDGIELEALKAVYSEVKAEDTKPWVTLGSVKSQIGHTKAAAGIAGFIKAALALYHKTLPPTLKVGQPHPVLQDSPFIIRNRPTPWLLPAEHKRLAAVSAFGFGGSNYHCVLEEYESQKPVHDWDAQLYWLITSAATARELQTTLGQIAAKLAAEPNPGILRAVRDQIQDADVERLAICGQSMPQLLERLRRFTAALEIGETANLVDNSSVFYQRAARPAKLAVIFTGQGSQYPNMLAGYASTSTQAHQALQTTDQMMNRQLFAKIYPGQSFSKAQAQRQNQDLAQTAVAQPAIGALSSAIWNDLQALGIQGEMFGGHSFGELTALYAAGVMSQQDYLKVAACRGDLMSNAAAKLGSMLALTAELEAVEQALKQSEIELVVANHNSPRQTVVAGDDAAIAAFSALAEQRGWNPIKLKVGAAFHSPRMAGLAEPFGKFLRDIEFSEPKQPVFANASAKPYSREPAAIRQGLCEQLAARVRFVEMIEAMQAAGATVFLEVGPASILSRMMSQTLAGQDAEILSFDSTRHASHQLQTCLVRLFVAGCNPEWSQFQDSWQAPYEPAAKFSVPICGANYRGELPPSTLQPQQKPKDQARAPQPLKAESQRLPAAQPQPTPPRAATIRRPQAMADTERQERSSVPQSLLEKNLVAMQKMQEQNAKLHEQFLKNQAENQRMFFELLQGVQANSSAPSATESKPAIAARKSRELSAAADVSGAAVPKTERSEKPVEPTARAVSQQPSPPPEVTVAPPPEVTVAEVSTPLVIDNGLTVSALVLAAIAEATGYPEDSLSLDMELEEDLGIDSIKRVEIFSKLQEKVPAIGALAAEELSELSSIAEIIVAAGTDNKQGAKPIAANAAPPVLAEEKSEQSSANPSDIMATVVAVIAAKTGYPLESLDPGMSLEDDLGIDSIKRVEIVSELQDSFPSLGNMDAEEISAVQTIAELGTLLDSEADSDRSPAAPQATESMVSAAAVPEAASQTGTAIAAITAVIAAKTGYPLESLNAGMNLEEDLGIDSIKKVEILSELGGVFPKIAAASQDEVVDLHTIEEIAAFVDGAAVEIASEAPAARESAQPARETAGSVKPALLSRDRVASSKVILEPASSSDEELLSLSESDEIWITDDGSSFARNLVLKFKELNLRPKLVSIAFVDRMAAPEALAGLVVIGPLKLESHPSRFLLNCFKLIKLCAGALRLDDGHGHLLATVSRNDGSFGFHGLQQSSQVYSGALAGFTKSLDKEWPEVRCMHVDLSRDFGSSSDLAQQAIAAMLNYRLAEVAISPEGTFKTALAPLVIDLEQTPAFQKGDVVVVTGGAKGVTAALTARLAESDIRIAVWGRTELAELPDYLSPKMSDAEMKAAIHRSGAAQNPREIASIAAKAQSQIELQAGLAVLQSKAAEVRYMVVDVGKESAVRTALASIQDDWAGVHTLIHGAGVLADHPLEKISDKDFSAVIDTKLRLLPVIEKYCAESLKNVVFYSSSTARFGRVGQTAYAVANEALNKFAQYLNAKDSQMNAVAINWGPWAGGMVDDSLRKIFAEEGIGLIPLDTGSRLALSQIGMRSASEFVVLAEPNTSLRSAAQHAPQTGMIDLESYPILKSHVLNRKAVVPAVILLELMLAQLQGLRRDHLVEVQDFKVLKGITLRADEQVAYRITYDEQLADEGQGFIEVELFAQTDDGAARPSAKAKVLVSERSAGAAAAAPTIQIEDKWQHPELDELYETNLFHGDEMQGISALRRFGPDGVTATSLSSPKPSQWIKTFANNSWFADPLVIDVAFQLAVLWSEKKLGAKSLPIGFKCLKLFADFSSAGCEVRLKVSRVRGQSFMADIEFVLGGQLIASMTGYEAITDQSLDQSFARNSLEETASS